MTTANNAITIDILLEAKRILAENVRSPIEQPHATLLTTKQAKRFGASDALIDKARVSDVDLAGFMVRVID